MIAYVLKLADRYATWGLSGMSNNEQSRRYAFNVLCLGGAISAAFLALVFLAYDLLFDGGDLRLIWSSALTGVVVGILPLLTARNVTASVTIGTAYVITFFGFLTYHLGADSGIFLFMAAGILGGLVVMGTDRPHLMFVLCAAALSGMIVSYLAFPAPSGAVPVSDALQRIVFLCVLVILSLMISTTVATLSFRVAKAEAALEAEHARSEALLQNLLPAEIAQRLKDRPGEVIADGLPAVTLLFADIVDFTPRAAARSPEEIVAFLNRIFSRFDMLTAERGLEKIKTIGDAYMVAAGLPVAREDHAEIIAEMALQMQAEAARLSDEMGEEMQLRIGIHSGPAIAGVIGTSKVFYDVWGDTVNTASRMESHSEPGRIQITASTRALLGDRFKATPRGPVEIKGIGTVETWWLDAQSQ